MAEDQRDENELLNDELNDQEAESEALDPQWIETLGRLGLDEVDLLRFTDEDLLYLAKRWQFLQVVESTESTTPLDQPEFIEAKSGWTIQYYGDAMATSPGRLIFGGGYFRVSSDDDDDEGGGVVNPGRGTFYKQAFDTVTEMVQIAQDRGWGGMMVVDGHPDMMRTAWIEAVRIGMKLDGYTATMADEKIRRRVVSASVEEMRAAIRALKND